MSQESIDEILKRFDELSANERVELLAHLASRPARTNKKAASKKTTSKSLLESFQERGLVGSIKGAPADWSTNPDYLSDFGKQIDAQ